MVGQQGCTSEGARLIMSMVRVAVGEQGGLWGWQCESKESGSVRARRVVRVAVGE